MTLDELLGTIGRLGAQAEALGALAALARIEGEGLATDPDVARRLREVGALLGVELDGLPPEQLAIASGMARALLLQAGELAADPGRSPGWVFEDPAVLQAAGAQSASIPPVLDGLVGSLAGLRERLDGGGCFLDVGCGVARLAIAAARTWPHARVIGVDPWEPSLRLAHANVAQAGLDDRVELRRGTIETLGLDAVADLVFLPGPFLSPAALPSVLSATTQALTPGGWLAFGLYAGPPDALATALTELRTLRSGGLTAAPEAVLPLVVDVGFEDVHVPERTWNAPVAFVLGRRAG